MRAPTWAFLAFIPIVIGIAPRLQADVLATDNASNYLAAPGWINRSNGGSGTPGFPGAWAILTGGNASASVAKGTPLGPYAWDLQADDDGSGALAERDLPPLPNLGSIELDLDAGKIPDDSNDGFAGVSFYDDHNNPELELEVWPYLADKSEIPNDDYIILDGNDDNKPIDTGISADGAPIHMDLKLIDAATHAFTITITQQGGASYTSPVGSILYTGTGTYPDQIDEVQFSNSSTGTDFYLNNLVVVPLPITLYCAIPLLGLIACQKLRRI